MTAPEAAKPVPWMTVPDVAADLNVSKMTVYRLIKGGDLAAYRFGSSLRIHRADLNVYIRESGVRL